MCPMRRLNVPPRRNPSKAWILSLLVVGSCGVRSDRYKLGAGSAPLVPVAGASVRGTRGGADGGCGHVLATDGGITAVAGKARFAVIGDYGRTGANEANVAALVKGWSPDFVITTGDNNYPSGSVETIDINIGQYYHDFIGRYVGQYGCGASHNRFFPSLGNHDWDNGNLKPYQDYFALPGNERYYEAVIGDVHLFAVDSDGREPDGVTSDSLQAAWLRSRLALSTARWKIVYMHHPPYSSGPHLSSIHMRWPYKAWGADIVFAGHDHDYERLEIDGLPYIVNGLGGASLYVLGERLPGSLASYDANFGAVLVDADSTRFQSRFFNTDGQLIDQLVLNKAP